MSAFVFEERTCGQCANAFQALTFWSDDSVCDACSKSDYTKRLAEINEGRAYTIESIGGACPTQAEGVWVDGSEYYFRARHGSWTLRLAGEDGDAVSGAVVAGGDDPSGGWMELDEVLALLDKVAAS